MSEIKNSSQDEILNTHEDQKNGNENKCQEEKSQNKSQKNKKKETGRFTPAEYD